jgi:CubicO group peptidase (beta-lactamase class C family)
VCWGGGGGGGRAGGGGGGGGPPPLGSTWLVDPGHDLVVIVLTQRAFGSAQAPQVHQDIEAAAYAALA